MSVLKMHIYIYIYIFIYLQQYQSTVRKEIKGKQRTVRASENLIFG